MFKTPPANRPSKVRAATLPIAERAGQHLALGTLTIIALAAAALSIGAAKAHAAAGDYTTAQAASGAQVYSEHCAACHGTSLGGQSGPALAGSDFAASLSYSKMSATQLYDFIAAQMPADDPHSLTQEQYADVLAYLLSKSGYPSGEQPLSQNTLNQDQLLPYPGSGPQAPSAQ